MKHYALWGIIIAIVLALSATLFNSLIMKPDLYEAKREPNPHEYVRKMGVLSAEDVNVITIVSRRRPDMYVELNPATDRQDIERILQAVKGIQFSDKPVRSHWLRDRIFIDATTSSLPESSGKKVRFRYQLRGCFDPARAPVISPAMRSKDLGPIVEDIVKRKGKTVRKKDK